eukprot:TRINITY_DN5652_c0_g1_i6.p1 TRINITY_DN5652_c0_g1~~TRINITY_DN5652_c0_g1_i6.p1  ORF type:complete len:167 (+),score=39.12 TRINITY_DN5652_c0_g1_i6:139-639(+)
MNSTMQLLHYKENLYKKGVSGETVAEIGQRLGELLRLAAERSQPYHFVIVLAGTNDLAKPTGDIFEALLQLYNQCLAHGARVVAVTIPESYFKSEQYVRRREETNQKILSHARNHPSHFLCVDLCRAIPYEDFSKPGSLWDDHLHFNPQGYNQMALTIFQSLHPWL